MTKKKYLTEKEIKKAKYSSDIDPNDVRPKKEIYLKCVKEIPKGFWKRGQVQKICSKFKEASNEYYKEENKKENKNLEKLDILDNLIALHPAKLTKEKIRTGKYLHNYKFRYDKEFQI